MKNLLLVIFFSLATSLAYAEELQNTEIENVIGDQITAFQADDFERAFEFASPNIKGIFGTPERFGRMVQNGFPMVWRPSSVRYLELREIAGRLYQKVVVEDGDGQYHVLDYEMLETADGWQINGVQLLRAPSVGA